MRIAELWLQTSKLVELLGFYTKTLELPLVGQTVLSFTVQIGASKLTYEQAVSGQNPVYHFAFNIPENQIAQAKVWLEHRVPTLADAAGQRLFRSESWNADMFYFYDLSGNVLELIARHGLANPSSQPFTAQSLLNISEIGIASVNPAQTAKQLGQPLYNCQPNGTFMPVGDEHGLFIVVREGRVWFPDTGQSAEQVPFKVLLENGMLLSNADLNP